MVFYIRTRRAWDDLKNRIGIPNCPVWVENDVLTKAELEELRKAGTNITNFTTENREAPDTETIRLHHPDEVIWVEA